MPNLHRIPEAIAELESLEDPNLTEIAKKYGVTRRTLENRWKGKTVSMQESVSTNRQALTNAQEKALIQLINDLSNRRLPPTTAIVKNLAEEIRGKSVGKNWTASFVHRHRDVLKSQYLTCIDNRRVKSEYRPSYEQFYKLVKYIFTLLFILYYRSN
jgi:transposase-like protein